MRINASQEPRDEGKPRPLVLTLATTFPAHSGDGVPDFVLALGERLSNDFDIRVITPRIRGAATREQIGRVEVFRFPYFVRPFEGLAEAAILPTLRAHPWRIIEVVPLIVAMFVATMGQVRHARPDLIHAHWILPCGAIAMVMQRLAKIPYVVTAHGADGFALRGRLLRILKQRVLDRSSVTSATSRQMAAVLNLPETVVVPMGVDGLDIAQRVGARRPEPGRFLFVGRLEDKKGVDVLIQALANTADARAVILGDGQERARLERLALDLGVSDRTDFRGQASRDQVVSELRSCCAVVIPSRVGKGGDSDTTPLVMSEAIASGVPVLASALGGLAETITSGVNGLLFESGSPGALADALRYAIDRPEELEAMAAAASKSVRERLDIARTAERYSAFYREALSASA